MSLQSQLDFRGVGSLSEAGLERMRKEAAQAMQELARKMGLPLYRKALVTLRCGREFRGKLTLHDPMLFTPDKRDPHLMLEINGIAFPAKEIAACQAMD